MSTARAERLVNLVLALLSTRQYLTADRVRQLVPGYVDVAGDEAFSRMFERDKAELRQLGIPLETGRNSVFDAVEGYRIARRDYELGDIDLAADEAAAVALAVRLWDSPELTGQAHGALVKLRAAGVEVDDQSVMLVEPRVHTDPPFAPLLSAVRRGCAVRFDYRRAGSPERRARTVEPWGVVSWRARWYLVGHDRDRAAPRCFRLSRIRGSVRTVGAAGAVQRPEDVNLLEFVAGPGGADDAGEAAPAMRARLWLAEGRAAGIRRRARVLERAAVADVDGDVVELEVSHPESAAEWIAGYAPDALVLEPDVLAKAVVDRWERLAHGGDAGPGGEVSG